METFQAPAPSERGLFHELGLSPERAALIDAVKDGLPTRVFVDLARRLGVAEAALAEVVGLSVSTLQRRKRAGELTPAEGEHVLRVAALLERARQVFGAEDVAADWLTHENLALGHATPLRMADTELGAREVEDLLGRLEHGVYS
jgi:putative toxin-antitoxin system antitoxin component (TIGR02293 family)